MNKGTQIGKAMVGGDTARHRGRRQESIVQANLCPGFVDDIGKESCKGDLNKGNFNGPLSGCFKGTGNGFNPIGNRIG
eukprot:scaffold2880_cov173-Amphora_coffeaeformis.AAC.10